MNTTLHSYIRKMLALGNTQANLPEVNFKEKVRCGEVYRNLNGNEMFQKFYYRCLECSLDFESSTEFEEHVIAHYLQDDEQDCTEVDNAKNNENVISISSDEEDEEENGYLYAFEVASLVEENISENDLPLPLMQMLGEHSDSCDQTIQLSESDGDDERSVVFPCDGLRKQALHQYSEHCCTQCPAYFNTKSELNFHLHIHTLPNTVVCQHCYEAFANVIKLNEHISLTKKKRIRKNNKDRRNESDNIQNSKRAKNQTQVDALPPNAMDITEGDKNDENNENNRCIDVNEIRNIAKGLQDNIENSGENEAIISNTNNSSNCQKNNFKDCDSNVDIKNVLNDT